MKKCPFEAIQIINLPKDLDKETTHRYGPNTFKLHREIIFDILTKLPAKSLSRFRYAYAVASALHGVQHILRKDFMIQPPWDTEIGKTCIIHFTYGCDYALKGELTYDKIGEWRFDKRSYFCGPPPKNLPLPPPVPKVWSLW